MLIKNWFYYIIAFSNTLALRARPKDKALGIPIPIAKMGIGIILFLSLTVWGCEETALVTEPPPPFDTELSCPRNNYKVILLETTPADIRRAIEVAIREREEFHTTENYTVLKLRSKKTFFIKDITPEQMQYCYLIAIPIPNR